MSEPPTAPGPVVVTGHAGLGDPVRGVALVAKDGFSARYDLDRRAGCFSRASHALAGQSYVGQVLVLDRAKGGVASAWMLHEMVANGKAPLALLFNFANPVIAQGSALAGIPLMDRFSCDITEAIRTGDRVEVEPAAGRVRILGP